MAAQVAGDRYKFNSNTNRNFRSNFDCNGAPRKLAATNSKATAASPAAAFGGTAEFSW
jgi:hypothetical protein